MSGYWDNVAAALPSLASNPLFNIGLGMLSTPYQRTPVSFGQVLGNGVAQMDYAQQQAAKQQQAQQQAQIQQWKFQQAQQQAKQDEAQRAAQAKLAQNLGPDATPYEQYLAQYDPAGYAKLQAQKAAEAKPIFDARDGGFVNPQTRAFAPITVAPPGQVPIPSGVPRVGQALDTTVPGANGQNVSFNFPAGTPPQVIAAAKADAVARGDITPAQAASVGAAGSPTSAAQPTGAPLTLAQWRAQQKPAGGGFATLTPGEIQSIGLPAGTIAQRGPNGQIHVLSKGDAVPDEQSLAQLDPQTQALVKKVANYEVMPQNLSNYVRPGQGLTRQQILGYAAVLNPDYNVNNAEAAGAYLKDMAKSSPTSIGGQTQSLNMILHHLGPMMQANAALAGTGNQLVNKVENTLNTTFRGDSAAGVAPANWDQGRTFVSQELGKLLKGGVASEGEVKDLESGLNAAKSPYQRAQALYNIADYVYGKIQAMSDRRDRLLGGMAPKTSLLDAQAEKNLIGAYKLGGFDAPELLPPGTNYATGAAQGARPGAPQVGAVEGGYRFKGGDPSQQSSWERVQ